MKLLQLLLYVKPFVNKISLVIVYINSTIKTTDLYAGSVENINKYPKFKIDYFKTIVEQPKKPTIHGISGPDTGGSPMEPFYNSLRDMISGNLQTSETILATLSLIILIIIILIYVLLAVIIQGFNLADYVKSPSLKNIIRFMQRSSTVTVCYLLLLCIIICSVILIGQYYVLEALQVNNKIYQTLIEWFNDNFK